MYWLKRLVLSTEKKELVKIKYSSNMKLILEIKLAIILQFGIKYQRVKK